MSRLRVKLGEAEFESQGRPQDVSKAFGKFTCWLLRKHKRGKLIGEQSHPGSAVTIRIFSCPRCGNTTKYRVKNAYTGGDQS